jgi:riboflavin transporter FmnP
MNTQSVALIAIFAALAIALNIIRIPVLYWPGWFYTLCDIPVMVSFFIYGFRIAILVEVLHIAGQEIFFPAGPGGIVVYPMGLIFHFFMFLGIYLANKVIKHEVSSGGQFSEKKRVIYLTGFATALRGALMPIIDYGVLYSILLPLVLGVTFPATYMFALIPAFVLFNVTSTLYLVPIAYFIARKTSTHLKIEKRFLI